MYGGKISETGMSSSSKGKCGEDDGDYRIAIAVAEELLNQQTSSGNEVIEAISSTEETGGFSPTTNDEIRIKIEATETLFELEESEALDLNTMEDLSSADPLDVDTLALDPLGNGEETGANTMDNGAVTMDPADGEGADVNTGANSSVGHGESGLLLNTEQEQGEGSGSRDNRRGYIAETVRQLGGPQGVSLSSLEDEQESSRNAVEESISFSRSIYEDEIENGDRGQESQQSMSPVVKMEVEDEVLETGREEEVDEGRGTESDWRERHKSMKEKLSFILKTSGMKQDVAFIVGPTKKRILAHSFILWLNSPVFPNWFGEDNRTTAEGEGGGFIREINIYDVEPAVFEVILTFIYTEKAEIREDNVIPVYEAAKKQFLLDGLSSRCTSLMKKWLNLQNVVKYFKLADEYNEVELFDQAKCFIMENANLVFNAGDMSSLDQKHLLAIVGQDDLEASELTIFQMLLSWAANRCFTSDQKPTPDRIREALGPLIYQIRFPLLSAEDFKVYVVPENILRPQEVIQLFTYFTPPFDKTGTDFPFETNPRRFHTETEADTAASTAGSITTEESSGSKRSSRRSSCRSASASSVKTEESAESSRRSKPQKRSSGGKDDENTDDEWDKTSSEDSDSDSSEEFIPPGYPRRQVQKRQCPSSSSSQASFSQPCKKMKLKVDQGVPSKYTKPIGPIVFGTMPEKRFQNWTEQHCSRTFNPDKGTPTQGPTRALNRDQITVEPSNLNSKDLSLFVRRLAIMDPKCLSNISKIQEDLLLRSIPQTRVLLPNLTELELNLTTLRLGKSFTMSEFKEATLFYLQRLCSIIFVDSFPTPVGSDKTCLDNLWHSEMRISITFHGLTVLKSNPMEGELVFSYLRNEPIRSITEGLALSRHALKKLVVVECDFRLLNIIPMKHLTHVTFLKAHGLQGINNFLRLCPNLQELHWDGSGIGSRIINLDEDLNIFSHSSRLKVLVISNVLISLKKVDGTLRPSKIRFPRFYFCEFSPIVMNHFHLIFPFLGSIHFRNYPALKFMESILDMPHLQFVGIWGAKLLTDVPSDPKVSSFTTYLTQKEVKAKIKNGNIANKMGKFVGNAFFLSKKSPNGGPLLEVNWEVSETTRNLTWSNEVLNVIYQDFEYKSIVNFVRFKMLFHTYY